MARPSMSELIARMRMLVGDPAGADSAFSDDEIEMILDRHRTTVRYAPLHAAPTMLPNGTIEYRDYYADFGDWEADEKLFDASRNELSPLSADRNTGHWAFPPPGQTPPVLIVGKTYDVYAAAAELLEIWAAAVKLEFDFSTDGQTFDRSQKVKALLALAAEYRRHRRPMVATMTRSDVGPAGG